MNASSSTPAVPSYVCTHVTLSCQALGSRLVLKTSRSGPAVLTEAGAAVLPYCQQLLEVACEACKAMQDFRLVSTGVVSLGASQTVGTYLMPRLIAAFKKNNPEVGSASLMQDLVDLGPSPPPPFPDFLELREVLVGYEYTLLFLVLVAAVLSVHKQMLGLCMHELQMPIE